MPKLKNVYWIEMVTDDTDQVSSFYSEVIGLQREAVPEDDSHTSYSLRDDEGGEVLGICDKGIFKSTPAGWLPYIHVENFEESVSKVESAGGKILQQTAMDYHWKGQRFCLVSDPSGNRVMLCETRP